MMKTHSFFILLFLIINISISAQTPILIDPETEYIELGTSGASYEIFIDQEGELALEAVMNREFIPGKQDMNHLFHKGNLWIRFALESAYPDQENFIIDSVETETDRMEFYIIDSQGSITSYRMGRTVAVSEHPIDSWKMALPLSLEAGEKVWVYASFSSCFLIRTPIRISTQSVFDHMATLDTLLTAILLGSFIAFLLNHLALFITTKNRLFLYSSGYIMSLTIYLATIENLLHNYLFESEGFISGVILPRFNMVMPLLALIFLHLYLRTTLKDIKKAVLLRRILAIVPVLLGLYSIFQYFLKNIEPVFIYYTILYITAILLVIAPIIYIRYISRAGRIFIFSLIPLAALIIIQQFQNMGILGINPITVIPSYTGETFFTGLLIQILILSMLTSSLLRDKDKKEQQLAMEIESARDNYKIRSQMIQNIVHEVKTPLSLITLLLERLPESQREIRDKLSQQIHEIVNYIRRFSKEENLIRNEAYLHLKEIDLFDIIQTLVSELSPLADKRKQSIKQYLPDSIPSFVSSDFMIRSILRNLISNAIKYSPRKEVISVSVLWLDDILQIEVRDRGPGIPPEEESKIFNRGYRMENHATSDDDSMGLGLYISQEMATTLGGRIEYSTYEEGGACFSLRLPISQKIHSQNILEPIPIPVITSGDEKKRILIIEDNYDLQKELYHSLCDRYTVFMAGHGKEALENLKTYQPDLIISDVMMPVMDGFSFHKEFMSLPHSKGIPFLFLTAAEELDKKLKGLSQGATDYIPKPFEIRELKEKISNLLQLREGMSETIIDAIRANLYKQEEDYDLQSWKSIDIFSQELSLTQKEKGVLNHLLKGSDDWTIERELNIKKSTLNSHRYSIFRKTGSNNILELKNKYYSFHDGERRNLR